jgi:hypothetical protein
MTHVVVVVPGLGPLALTPEALRTARAKGLELVGDFDAAVPAATTEAPALLDADQLEARTGIPATWWMAQARERRVPHQRIGRRVRFDFAEVMGSEAVRKRSAVAEVTGQPIQKGRASG